MVGEGSVRLNHPELVLHSLDRPGSLCHTVVWSSSETLNYLHSPCSQCSFCSAVVQRGSVGLNHPVLMLHSLTDLVHCVIRWFDQPNACSFTLYFLYCNMSLKWFNPTESGTTANSNPSWMCLGAYRTCRFFITVSHKYRRIRRGKILQVRFV